jgi:hypothetical protein
MPKITPNGIVELHGILGGKDASAVALWKGRALVVSDEVTDEGNVLQVLDADGPDFRAAANGIIALDVDGEGEGDEEMDLEGIAVSGSDIFVIGSHSAKRKKVDPDKKYKKNLEALLAPPKAEPARDVLLHLRLTDDGQAGEISRTSLRDILESMEPFASFTKGASKENGVDIEGLAVWKSHLYVGFRGPVLRGNFTPILRCKFGVPVSEPEVLFVDLGGRGVRDLAHVADGLVILAGPIGDGPGSYQIYLWDGRDMVPGVGSPADASTLRLIGDLPSPVSADGTVQTAAKAEGLAVENAQGDRWELLVVYDGLESGQAARFTIDVA